MAIDLSFFEFVTDGDLLVLVCRMLDLRGRDTVRTTKVKGHADEGLVLDGHVRELDWLGNNAADEAADLSEEGRSLIFICSLLPFLGPLLIMMGMVGLLLILWFGLLVLCQRGDGGFMQSVTWPCCLGHVLFGLVIGLLVLLLILVLALHSWSSGQMGCLSRFLALARRRCGPWSDVELPTLYELWVGERLILDKAHPRYLRPGRPISVSAVPFGPGIDTWRSCRFIGAMMRSLCMLPGGLGRIVPCANHCRLRHVGWDRCSHGLISRPRESASGAFLDQLLLLFQYPPRSSRALLAGTIPLRYCSAKFARRVPFWTLPVLGHVAGLITADVQVAQVDEVEVGSREIHWVSGSGSARKRIRLNRKNKAHLVGLSMHADPRVWKRLHCSGYSGISGVDCKRRRFNQHDLEDSPAHPRTGVG